VNRVHFLKDHLAICGLSGVHTLPIIKPDTFPEHYISGYLSKRELPICRCHNKAAIIASSRNTNSQWFLPFNIVNLGLIVFYFSVVIWRSHRFPIIRYHSFDYATPAHFPTHVDCGFPVASENILVPNKSIEMQRRLATADAHDLFIG
jgi:hypothetical protein